MSDNQHIPEDECSSEVDFLESGGFFPRDASTPILFAGPAIIKSEEQTSRLENPPFVQSSLAQPMNFPASEVKGRTRVSSERAALLEFRYGMNASSARLFPKEASSPVPFAGLAMIKTEEQTSRLEKSSFVQNPMTQHMNRLASEVEGRASSEEESLLQFRYGMKASSSSLFPQEAFSPVPFPGILMIKPGEQTSRVESPPFFQNPMTQHMNLPASEVEREALISSEDESTLQFCYGMNTSSRPYEEILTGNETMLGDIGGTHQRAEHLLDQMHKLSINTPSPSKDRDTRFATPSSYIENFEGPLKNMNRIKGSYGDNSINNVPPVGRYEVYSIIDKEFPSNRQDQDFNLSEGPFDKRVEHVAKLLLSACNESIQQGENPDSTSKDISVEYLKLYERRPENYDFALNIMAHIELLNDNSWTATVSYFDENVKKMVTRVWDKLRITFSNTMNLQECNRDDVLKTMMDFTLLSINADFKFKNFIKYCVLICHLGVIARKLIAKDVSYYAVCQLRYRMKFLKYENLAQHMFDIVVKDYAKRQCRYNI